MNPMDAPNAFASFLSRRGHRLDGLVPADGVPMMLAFYQEVPAEGCNVEQDGDMLLYQWGTYDWGNGSSFEVSIVRQFILGDSEDDDIWQLSLKFNFPPTSASAALSEGNRWCHRVNEVDAMSAFIQTNPAYLATSRTTPLRVELDFECAG